MKKQIPSAMEQVAVSNSKFAWEYAAFATLFATFLSMEMIAVKTGRIKPASNLIWWMDRGEISHHVLAGAWAGFCVWTWRHWFIRGNDI